MIPAANNIFYGSTNLVELHAQITKDCGGNAIAFTYQAEQKMLRPNIIMPETSSLLLSEAEDFPCLFRGFIKAVFIPEEPPQQAGFALRLLGQPTHWQFCSSYILSPGHPHHF